MAFALGAIVSPTDAVAVNAIMERLRVPARMSTILNGESLMNDATGLVAFKFALAAIVAGSFPLSRIAFQFPLISVGGFAIGFAIGYAIGRLRDLLLRLHVSDALIEITLSLMTPYAAYLAAEHLGVSGVIAVGRRRTLLRLARPREDGRGDASDGLRRLEPADFLA